MKSFNFRRYNFLRLFKNIDFNKYNPLKVFKKINPRRYKPFKILENVDLYKYRFSNFVRKFNYRRINFSRFFKKISLERLNLLGIFQSINYKKYNYFLFYLIIFTAFLPIIYISIPLFFNYNKLNIQNIICKDLHITCTAQDKIKYSFFPSPRIKLKNFIIQDFTDTKKVLGKADRVDIKLSIFNLHNKKKIKFTKVFLKNLEININLKNIEKYKDFLSKKFSSKPIKIENGIIQFYDGKKYITSIENSVFKYSFNKKINEMTLNGNFLGDNISIDFENNRLSKKLSQIIVLKLKNSQVFTKINIFKSPSNPDVMEGKILFKKEKTRLTGIFDYKKDKLSLKNANFRNTFLDGKFVGVMQFLPYFQFNLDADLNNVNFIKFYDFLINLNKDKQKDLFKINKKINGQLNLSANKIYSKSSLINSFESRIKFENGDIFLNQCLLNLGKFGAADILGVIKNTKKFTKFKFQKNIFIDNQRYFLNKFGIYNRKNVTSNLFVSGNINLKNLKMHINEISDEAKYKDEDVNYIENEFNEILLTNGYESLFNFSNLKEFMQSIIEDEE